jgi:hypothetical protein
MVIMLSERFNYRSQSPEIVAKIGLLKVFEALWRHLHEVDVQKTVIKFETDISFLLSFFCGMGFELRTSHLAK